MIKELSIENLVTLIRTTQGISKNKVINESTLLESDLGITGDDGRELLEEIENQFNLSFVGKDGTHKEFFDLENNQYLFHSEGVDLFGIFSFFLGRKTENVKSISVGELYNAASKAKRNSENG